MKFSDLAWLAGLVEGEGSVCPVNDPKYRHWRITLNMTDEDVVRRAHEVSGVGTVSGPYDHGKKPRWFWSVNKQADVRGLAGQLYPLLGDRRRAKVREMFEQQRTV